jgi:KTSC domain
MSMIPVISSAVAAVGYENGTMAVQFHNNPKTYRLPNVPYSLFEAFVNAPSPGEFWNRYLHGKFK